MGTNPVNATILRVADDAPRAWTKLPPTPFGHCGDANSSRSSAQQRAGISAVFLPEGERREPSHYTPESSRRARSVAIWAALRSLGRSGLAEMIERDCRCATRFAEGLVAAGYEVLNDVVLNQVLVSFGSPEETTRVIEATQAEGTCWCGPTVWQGRSAMRISVCSWRTTEADVDRSLAAIVRAAREQV